MARSFGSKLKLADGTGVGLAGALDGARVLDTAVGVAAGVGVDGAAQPLSATRSAKVTGVFLIGCLSGRSASRGGVVGWGRAGVVRCPQWVLEGRTGGSGRRGRWWPRGPGCTPGCHSTRNRGRSARSAHIVALRMIHRRIVPWSKFPPVTMSVMWLNRDKQPLLTHRRPSPFTHVFLSLRGGKRVTVNM